jgi:hypothetical protein
MAPPWLTLTFTLWHDRLLAFTLGTFFVAAWSDLKHMGAQKEFGHAWIFLMPTWFAADTILTFTGDLLPIAAKLVLMLAFGLLSNAKFGVMFALAWGDILAVWAVLSLLPWVYGLIFLMFLKVLDLVMRPLLRVAGHGDAYPFMPVVFAATVSVLAFAYLVAPNLPL